MKAYHQWYFRQRVWSLHQQQTPSFCQSTWGHCAKYHLSRSSDIHSWVNSYFQKFFCSTKISVIKNTWTHWCGRVSWVDNFQSRFYQIANSVGNWYRFFHDNTNQLNLKCFYLDYRNDNYSLIYKKTIKIDKITAILLA